MRFLWLLLLPLVWVPLLAVLAVALPGLPWYGWVFGLLFSWLLMRRIRAGRAVDQGPADPAGLRFSPTHRSGGLW